MHSTYVNVTNNGSREERGERLHNVSELVKENAALTSLGDSKIVKERIIL